MSALGSSSDPDGVIAHPPAAVLVVEDDDSHRVALELSLTARGYVVATATTGSEALEQADIINPEVILLDLGLPDIDGLDLCRHLVVRHRCPVIVVSADAVEDHIVAALDLGAHDYVVKPFGMNVLLARLRRAVRYTSRSTSDNEEPMLVCGDVGIDVSAHRVFVDGVEIDVQARQYALLVMFVRNEGRVLTYTALRRAIWDYCTTDVDLPSLRTGVSRLRKQLGEGPRRPIISNESRVGYRLTAPPI